MGVEIQCHGNQIHIARAFSVAKERALYPIGSGHHRQLRRGHRRAPVVMRMHAEHDRIAALQVAAHPLDLVGVDVGRRVLNRRGKIDDGLVLRRGLPDIEHRLADLQRVVQLGPGKTLRRILEDPLRSRIRRGDLLEHPCAVDGDLLHALAIQLEDHLALQGRGRVIEVNDRARRALQRLKGAMDQVFARLCQHLHGHIRRDAALLNQLAAKIEVGLRGGGKANLDLLEAEPHQQIEHAVFALRVHRLNQRLIAVAQVNAAPRRSLVDGLARPLAVVQPYGRSRRVLGCWMFQCRSFFSLSR